MKMTLRGEEAHSLLRERERVHSWLYRGEVLRFCGQATLSVGAPVSLGLLTFSSLNAAALVLAVPFLFVAPVPLSEMRFALYKRRMGRRAEARKEMVEAAATFLSNAGVASLFLYPLLGKVAALAGLAFIFFSLPFSLLALTQRWWNRKGKDEPEALPSPMKVCAGLFSKTLISFLLPSESEKEERLLGNSQ